MKKNENHFSNVIQTNHSCLVYMYLLQGTTWRRPQHMIQQLMQHLHIQYLCVVVIFNVGPKCHTVNVASYLQTNHEMMQNWAADRQHLKLPLQNPHVVLPSWECQRGLFDTSLLAYSITLSDMISKLIPHILTQVGCKTLLQTHLAPMGHVLNMYCYCFLTFINS